MPKSITRIKIEKAIEKSGVKLSSRAIYTDRSLSGWRMKFAFTKLKPKKMNRIRKQLRKQFPNQDVRIWYVDAQHIMGFGGIAIKVFN